LRFLLDEHLPVALASVIEQLGHEAMHVKTLGLLSARDGDIWALAKEAGATVISKDSDFLALAQRDGRTAGLVHLNLGNISNRDLFVALRAAWPDLTARLRLGDSVVELRP